MSDLALLSIASVCERVGLSRATIYRMVEAETFPAPRKIGIRSLWFSGDIDAFVLAIASGSEWKPSMGQNMGQAA